MAVFTVRSVPRNTQARLGLLVCLVSAGCGHKAEEARGEVETSRSACGTEVILPLAMGTSVPAADGPFAELMMCGDGRIVLVRDAGLIRAGVLPIKGNSSLEAEAFVETLRKMLASPDSRNEEGVATRPLRIVADELTKWGEVRAVLEACVSRAVLVPTVEILCRGVSNDGHEAVLRVTVPVLRETRTEWRAERLGVRRLELEMRGSSGHERVSFVGLDIAVEPRSIPSSSDIATVKNFVRGLAAAETDRGIEVVVPGGSKIGDVLPLLSVALAEKRTFIERVAPWPSEPEGRWLPGGREEESGT